MEHQYKDLNPASNHNGHQHKNLNPASNQRGHQYKDPRPCIKPYSTSIQGSSTLDKTMRHKHAPD